MDIFEIKNLTFTYPGRQTPALKNIDIKVKKGEFLLLAGPSGGGKTTLLSHLKTALTPYGERTGEIFFEGNPLDKTDLKIQSEKIGYVLQNPDRQIVSGNVLDELCFGPENLGISQEDMRRQIAETVYFFGMEKWLHRDVNTLSGGQKQLVNLASVMVTRPRVLLLDEPTAALDPIAAGNFLSAIERINRQFSVTVIISEHRTGPIMPVADRVMVMSDGKIVYAGPPREAVEESAFEKAGSAWLIPRPAKIFIEAEDLIPGFENCTIPLDIKNGKIWLEKTAEIYNFKPSDPKIVPTPSADSETAVKLKDVWFRYKKENPDILKGLNLDIPKGKILSILGGNGTGKSTLLKVICDICRPYQGKVALHTGGKCAYLPSEAGLIMGQDTVMQELKASGESSEKIDEISRLCELEGLPESHPYDISVGQRQFLGLAKILLSGADILLLDEITRGMDGSLKEKLGHIFRQICISGKTVVMVSHDVEFCAEYSDLIAMFFDGETSIPKTPGQFFGSNNYYTTSARLIAGEVFPGAVTTEQVAELCRENLKNYAGNNSIKDRQSE